MLLRSLNGCRLAIGYFPYFSYNAKNGGGKAIIICSEKENILNLKFIPQDFSIPPLTYQTTRFLGIPLPPGLKIEMNMDKLDGTLNKRSGEVLLDFESRFLFSIFSLFTFPELFVKTTLETGHVKSTLFEESGLKRQKNGEAILVGIALIPNTGNKFLDFFLGLPTEALAVLRCNLR